ncbi:MAG TPA: CRISPR-associated protein Cas4 [Armatimonadetes bacterium]|nr:CRISPR-associated protein Cas4 [Armatimonadota bacterium]
MSAWSDEEWVPVSAVEHFSYCPRQMALIHLEGIFDENVYTLRGRALHERVDQAEDRMERGVRVVRALPIWSERLGLVGKADVVEFRDDRPIPVEYKSGKVRDHVHAKRQLCAQAMCLEEMFATTIREGYLYFGASRERAPVQIDERLRRDTEEIVRAIRKLILDMSVPPPVADSRCPNCSLVDSCLPKALREISAAKRAVRYEPLSEKDLP